VLNISTCSRLEADVKRLKSELQSSRCLEQELRSQIASLSFSDRTTKSELYQLRQENENLQSKYVSWLMCHPYPSNVIYITIPKFPII